MTRKFKFVVTLGYNKFSFDDRGAAISFAEVAARYFVSDDCAKKLKPLIEVVEAECED